ncbi:MAG TPA: TolC family protein [Planctomycetota bacterium]|nr:TolC family protein [Planctomycetota bacterium]
MSDLFSSAARFALAASLALGFQGIGKGQDPTAPPNPPPAPAESPAPAAPRGETRLELSLEQALKIALDNDLGLELEAIATEVASYEYLGSWGSFDPRVTATAAVTDSEFEAGSSLAGAVIVKEDTQEFSTGVGLPLKTGGRFDVTYGSVNSRSNNSFNNVNPSTTDTLGITFRQPLWRGAWMQYATSAQREREILWHKSSERFRQVRQQLLFDVNSAYWDLVAAIEQIGVADATLELGRRQLQQNQRRLDAGVGTGVEVLQAEANVAVRIGERLKADVDMRAAQDRLKSALFPGTDTPAWDTQIVPVTKLPDSTDPLVPPWDAALIVALEHRSELRQQRLEIDASDVRVERTRSERRFGLDLELSSQSRGFDGNSWDAFQSATSFEFPANRAALTLDVPILNRTARNAERAERARGRSARLVYAQLESQIAAEVREAVRQILYQAEAVKASVKSLELAERQLAAEQARYDEGLSTNFQVLEFQRQLDEARSSEKRARVGYAKALSGLSRAEGVLGEKETR